ncbi:MAG: exonuclease SbcCD subunit D [Lachnospiraceae bacterium]
MKLIHCADLHLDSPMTGNFTSAQARERRNEMLHTFERMVEYALQEGVRAILIAGDLYDSVYASAKTRDIVSGIIRKASEIDFLYLRGNHDAASGEEVQLPENVKMFADQWTSYRYDSVVITGRELSDDAAELLLDKQDLNIVVLHGAVKPQGQMTKDEISLAQLTHKGIDYLALGHYHAYQQEVLDKRGVYCYCGCLEGRGFDETGPKGFVLLQTKKNKVEAEFVPFASRTLHEVRADISGCSTGRSVEEAIYAEIRDIPQRDLVRVILGGEVSPESDYHVTFMESKFKERYYFFRLLDRSRLAIDIDTYRYDASLKGEFIRLVWDADLKEDEKSSIIKMGLRALRGEEIEA